MSKKKSNKKNRNLIKLASVGENGKSTGIFLVRKGRSKKDQNPSKLSFRKFDKVLRKHVLFVETKLNS